MVAVFRSINIGGILILTILCRLYLFPYPCVTRLGHQVRVALSAFSRANASRPTHLICPDKWFVTLTNLLRRLRSGSPRCQQARLLREPGAVIQHLPEPEAVKEQQHPDRQPESSERDLKTFRTTT